MRNAFFRIGGSLPQVAFEVTPQDPSAGFDVRAVSVINPFALPELKAFQCPGSL